MSVGLKIDVAKIKELLKKLQVDLTPSKIIRLIGLRGLKLIEQNFRKEGSVFIDGGWVPLKPATIAKKGSSKILQDKGDLKNSFDVAYKSSESGEWFSNDPKAFWHEHGTNNKDGSVRMPARPMLPNKDVVENLIEDVMNRLLKKYG